MKTYTAAQVREAERPLLAAGVPLMQRAAAALADEIRALLAQSGVALAGARVLVLAGAGNNGGDALFAAASLARDGAQVHIVTTATRVHDEGLAAALAAGARLLIDAATAGGSNAGAAGEAAAGNARSAGDAAASDARSAGDGVSGDARWFGDAARGDAAAFGRAATGYGAAVGQAAAESDIVVDGILGTGTSADPSLRGAAREAVVAVRDVIERDVIECGDGHPLVVAVDLPSGIGADDGAVPDENVLAAAVTVTFGGCKTGMLLQPAALYVGRLVVADIGLGDELARVTAG